MIVPIIELSNLRALPRALQKSGFAYVRCAGVGQQFAKLIDSHRVAAQLAKLDDKEFVDSKSRARASTPMPTRTSTTANASSNPRGLYSYFGTASQTKPIRAFQIGPHNTDELRLPYFDNDSEAVAHCVHRNKPIASAPDLMREIETVFDQANELSSLILQSLADEWRDVSLLQHAASEAQDGNAEFKAYPALSISQGNEAEAGVLLNEHADLSLITLLSQTPPPASAVLQLQTADNQWVNAPQIDDCVLVNVGSLLAQVTPLRATVHRVHATGDTPAPRASMAYFCQPQWHRRIDGTHDQVGDWMPIF